MIPAIRLHSQQLVNPDFDSPKDLVSWMGAIQAQDYTMSKWAVGIRLKSGTLQMVNEALQKGEHQSKAFNTFGLFRPVILHNGQIVGNWNKVSRKSGLSVSMEWFEKDIKNKKALLHKAEERYIAFLSNKGNR